MNIHDIKVGDELTVREQQVLHGMADGLTNAEIGLRLFIAENSVKTHARRVFRKLGANDRSHAVRLGFDCGLLAPQRTRKRVRAVLDAHRPTRADAPSDSRFAQLFDAVEAALTPPR